MVAIELGDIIQTRKQHPCGFDQWEVTRVGADVKLRCLKCGRVVMLDRVDFEKRFKKVIKHAGGQENERTEP